MGELLQLSARTREAGRDELPFVIVNETNRVIPYDQAVLWDVRTERIVAVSGTSRIEKGSPYVLLLERLYKAVRTSGRIDEVQVLGGMGDGRAVAADSVMAPQLLWRPIRIRGQTVAVLLLGRRAPWTEGEQLLLDELCGSYAQAWELARIEIAPVRPGRTRRLRRIALWVGVVALHGIALIPVRSSSIAPAEVIANAPAFVRAPFAGVVDSIAVAPNSEVKTGQVLVHLERRQLEAEYGVSVKSMEVATVQYRQVSQEAMTDLRAREQLATYRGKLEEARADYEYRRARLERADIPSPNDGIAVFNDPAEWIGRPVELGERIMLVSSPTSSRIEIDLPVSEATSFDEGSEVSFFSNLNPDQAVSGRVIFMSYATTLTPAGVLTYTARAELKEGSALRLGVKGTAKIYGPRRPLVVWLLRRPLAFIRQWIA